jgi:SAM-dependent methyltransferase
MRNIKRVLKNNGRLLIIDWRPDSFLRRFFSEHETAANRLVPHLKQNGFRLLRSFSIGRHHFGLLLENYA